MTRPRRQRLRKSPKQGVATKGGETWNKGLPTTTAAIDEAPPIFLALFQARHAHDLLLSSSARIKCGYRVEGRTGKWQH